MHPVLESLMDSSEYNLDNQDRLSRVLYDLKSSTARQSGLEKLVRRYSDLLRVRSGQKKGHATLSQDLTTGIHKKSISAPPALNLVAKCVSVSKEEKLL